MTGWRQAVFVRQRRIDLIQRALSTILDEESWSPTAPRRLRVGSADTSSRGWTMIAPELANFFLERGGAAEPRLVRLARELRCPAYAVDVVDSGATTLLEVDATGRMALSGATLSHAALGEAARADEPRDEITVGLFATTDELRARISAHARRLGPPTELADYLGALAGFPAWTRHDADLGAAGELVYEMPRIQIRANGRAATTAAAEFMALRPETREATVRATPRVGLPANDRRGRRPRSAARPRR